MNFCFGGLPDNRRGYAARKPELGGLAAKFFTPPKAAETAKNSQEKRTNADKKFSVKITAEKFLKALI